MRTLSCIIRIVPILAALLLLAGKDATLAVAAPSAAGVETTARWSAPMLLSGQEQRGGGWFPSVATDVYGQLHVVWQGRLPGKHESLPIVGNQAMSESATWLISRRFDGREWRPAAEIGAMGSPGGALRTAIAADNAGALHLLYRGLDLRDPQVLPNESEPIRYARASVMTPERPLAWSPPLVLSTRVPTYVPEIVSDSRGVLHAIHTAADTTGYYTVYYSRSQDHGETWTPPRRLDTDHALMRFRLQLKIDFQDRLHAVWEVIDPDDEDRASRSSLGFVYARSADGGDTWLTTPFVPDLTSIEQRFLLDGRTTGVQPAVGFDGRGQSILVWRDAKSRVLYSAHSSDGRAWSPPSRIGGISRGVSRPFDRFDMATDASGRTHLVFVAYPDGSSTMAVMHAEWTGYGWSDPEIISLGTMSRYPEWPRAVVRGGNVLEVVWFTGDRDTVDRTPTGIWHATKVLTAPAIAPLPLPVGNERSSQATPQPGPTRELTPAVRGPATPVPRVDIPPPVKVAADLQPSSLPLVAGLAAAGVVLGVYLLHHLRRDGR